MAVEEFGTVCLGGETAQAAWQETALQTAKANSLLHLPGAANDSRAGKALQHDCGNVLLPGAYLSIKE